MQEALSQLQWMVCELHRGCYKASPPPFNDALCISIMVVGMCR